MKRTAFLLLLIFSACASGPSRPAWTMKSSGAFKDAGEKVFYGVGRVTGIKNESLAFSTADNRARADIAKTIEVYSASLAKDYQASTTAGDFKRTSEEQFVEETTKTFTAVTLNGVVIVDHWVNEKDGTVYALARLDLEKFKDSVNSAKELNASVREWVKKNAEKAFDSLEKEEEKRGK